MTREAVDRRPLRPMTADTPPHRELSDSCHAIHPSDSAVTRLARDLRAQVRLVIEMHEPRKHVDLGPRDRLAGFPELANLDDFRALRIDDAVTADTPLHGRNAGKWRATCGAVAEIATQLVPGDVDTMTEVDRLLRRIRLRAGRALRGSEEKYGREHAITGERGSPVSHGQSPAQTACNTSATVG